MIDASAPPAAPQAAASQAAAAPAFASGASVLEKTVIGAQPDSAASSVAQPGPAASTVAQAPAAQPAAAQAATPQQAGLPDASVVTSNISATSASASAPTAQPEPPAAAPPQPAPTQPAPAAQPAAQPTAPQPAPAAPIEPAPVRPADNETRWEKPLPSVRQAPLIELFGGYAFARMDNGAGAYNNMNGGLGSFGWNWKPWLQLTGDTSYNFVTIAGTKYVLYGNHYGGRFFYRGHSRWRWSATPFAEALVGGSREDTTVSGASGYSTSQNCITYKVGGGVDLHPSRRWEIRLFDFDYYRTAFGTNLHQNNYWVSTGVVLRLFGGRGYE
jgi:hypothetical protein